MVVNGTQQFVGSDTEALARALRTQATAPPAKSQLELHLVSATLGNGTLTVDYTLAGPAIASRPELIAVLADDMDQTEVPRGENSGRTLHHVAVARALLRLTPSPQRAQQPGPIEIKVAVPSTFHPRPGAQHLILFAQSTQQGPVLATDSLPLL